MADPLGRLGITMEARPTTFVTVKGGAKYDHAEGRLEKQGMQTELE